MEYILKASGILVIFYLVYHLFLKKETFFEANRHFLLLGIFAALVLPLVTITKFVEVNTTVYEAISAPALDNEVILAAPTFNWLNLFYLIYFTGLAVLSIKFLVQLISLRRMINANKPKRENGLIYVETTKEVAPFSFFNYIFYNPAMYSSAELEAILQHEKAHSSQWHSADVLIAHLITIILWVNPLGWLYKKNIKQNLEFLADASATKVTASLKTYQYTLLRVSAVPYYTPITNAFYNSLIKKRIVMLHKSKSNKRNLFKYILVLPFLLLFVLVFNVETIAKTIPLNEQYSYSNAWIAEAQRLAYAISKEMTDEEITALASEVKNEGGELIVKKVKRNSQGHISSIKVTLKFPGSEVTGEYSNEEGIPTIHFGQREHGGLFINGGEHGDIHKEHVIHIESEDEDDGVHEHKSKYKVVVKNSGDDKTHKNVWVSSGDRKEQRIEIEEKNGKKIIKVDGKEVSEEELEEIESSGNLKSKRIKIKTSKGGDDDDVMIFMSGDDNDDEEDIKVISREGSGFFFIDTDGDENPIYILDGKEVQKSEVKNLSPDNIATINVYKGKKAAEKFGDKAKDGVVEITTKQQE